MKRLLVTLGVLLLIGTAIYWGLGNRGVDLGAAPPDSSQRATVVGARAAWTVATSSVVNGVRARLKHPDRLQVDTAARQGRRRLRLLYAGPNNEPPALTDGFSVTISLRPRPPGLPLDTIAQRQIRQAQQVGGAVIAPMRNNRLQGHPARIWTQESAMGSPVTHRLLALNERTVASISASVVGADTARYHRTIEAMLGTLRFVDAPPRVTLALLRRPSGEPERGCDDVVRIEHRVLSTNASDLSSPPARLDAALQTLFALDADSVQGARHFLPQTNETLSLDSVAVDTDTARVYLHGTLTGLRGVCDHPRARIQIEETARAVPGIEGVVLYRNGRRTDLTPDGRGAQ